MNNYIRSVIPTSPFIYNLMFRIMRMILKILVHIKKVERMPELCQVSFPRNAKKL